MCSQDYLLTQCSSHSSWWEETQTNAKSWVLAGRWALVERWCGSRDTESLAPGLPPSSCGNEVCLPVKSLQSCLTLGYSPPGSVHGILQARILEWILLQAIFPTQGSNSRLLLLLHWQLSPVAELSLGSILNRTSGIAASYLIQWKILLVINYI